MLKNGKWAPKLQRIAWGQILQMIKYKTEWYGKKLIQSDRFFPSSQLCHKCGYRYEGLAIDETEWECPHCHAVHDRDVNASINLLKNGLWILGFLNPRFEGDSSEKPYTLVY